ncbi:YesK family protein [Paenibacillus hunanensis]|uniref:YccA/Bax inhibitor family protein n=1 Tax=Paenibacillus hunanensis TaxID=539262 RepID=A0ABU1IUE8_9BACL|nr:YesK family protein [Paenibacillus hunanensis]MCL9661391.1 hypothetical protein [Paenibacillus hunanensis]MDR6242875.1 putative YccA/Bax inhibitor family protein [Paenibacillus hunanensis]WPP41771.1 YesK family protein [Paenibacillus hunanensis]GGJ03430.1 hypothetical protein GCM10008022_10510 [Paenibacillus hunanensis]
MGLLGIGGATGIVLLLVSIVLTRRNRDSRTIQFIPGLIGVLLGALMMIYSLFQAGWTGLGYLIVSIVIILGALAVLFIMLVVGPRIAGQRR